MPCPYCSLPLTGGSEDEYAHKNGERFAHLTCIGHQPDYEDLDHRATPAAGGSDHPTCGRGGYDWGYDDGS